MTSNLLLLKRHWKKAVRVERDPIPPITFSGYEWVRGEVGTYWSKYKTPESVVELKESVTLFCPGYSDKFIIEPCSDTDHVFLSSSENQPLFTFVYTTFFETHGFSLPFNNFVRSVLAAIIVAPTQLHPNSWAFMRAFENLCTRMNITPTAPIFLY